MSVRDTAGRPLRDLRLSITDRCNFRCRYCMPRELVDESTFASMSDLLTPDNFDTVVRAAASLGVHKVRLTGGEPLLRPDVADIVARIRAIDGIDEIALTTNGTGLADRAQTLQAAGLDRVTISLDALTESIHRQLADTTITVADVLDAAAAAQAAGLGPVKMNTVIIRGTNEDEIVPLVTWARDHDVEVRFIEYLDVGTTNGWAHDDVVPMSEIIDRVSSAFPLERDTNEHGAPARRWRFTDGHGAVGVVASVSAPFCGDCSRLRITATGQVTTCLFAPPTLDLREAIATGDHTVVAELIRDRWARRDDRYSEVRFLDPPDRKPLEMIQVGG